MHSETETPTHSIEIEIHILRHTCKYFYIFEAKQFVDLDLLVTSRTDCWPIIIVIYHSVKSLHEMNRRWIVRHDQSKLIHKILLAAMITIWKSLGIYRTSWSRHELEFGATLMMTDRQRSSLCHYVYDVRRRKRRIKHKNENKKCYDKWSLEKSRFIINFSFLFSAFPFSSVCLFYLGAVNILLALTCNDRCDPGH